MAKRLIWSALAGLGAALLLGYFGGLLAAALVYAYLYNQEIEAFHRAMHEAEFDCVRRPQKAIQSAPEAPAPPEP